ncbi:MAG TPA: heavy-metal-associated domain-containing protein [Ramlibacter sp.]|nr:heavy-metal-associated domain-containing protein [Ramlibacter sp.]
MKMQFAVLMVAGAMSLTAQAKTVKMEVNGMVCAFCAQGIDKKLRAMAPTQSVLVSLEHKVVAVQLKEGQDIPDDTLRTTLKDAGYDVTSIARVDDSVDTIRKSVKAK